MWCTIGDSRETERRRRRRRSCTIGDTRKMGRGKEKSQETRLLSTQRGSYNSLYY
jgi:hypothetical protein